jgi:hypothetical protein
VKNAEGRVFGYKSKPRMSKFKFHFSKIVLTLVTTTQSQTGFYSGITKTFSYDFDRNSRNVDLKTSTYKVYNGLILHLLCQNVVIPVIPKSNSIMIKTLLCIENACNG